MSWRPRPSTTGVALHAEEQVNLGSRGLAKADNAPLFQLKWKAVIVCSEPRSTTRDDGSAVAGCQTVAFEPSTARRAYSPGTMAWTS